MPVLNSKTTLVDWRTVNPLHGVQKVRGSNPLGSTRFLNSDRALLSQPVIGPVSFTAYRTADRPFTKAREEETMWRGSDGDDDPVEVSELLSAALHRRPTR
jgi:hypothetical protein